MTFDAKHFVVATCIVTYGEKFLVAQRSENEEKFPGYWYVPGGGIDEQDYAVITPTAAGHWFNPVEVLVAREVKEETGIAIANVQYLMSLSYDKKAGRSLCLSMYAEYAGGDIRHSEETPDVRWVTLAEVAHMHLIPGIFEQLLMVDDLRHGRAKQSWSVYEERAHALREVQGKTRR